jgi:hypothetical protein
MDHRKTRLAVKLHEECNPCQSGKGSGENPVTAYGLARLHKDPLSSCRLS